MSAKLQLVRGGVVVDETTYGIEEDPDGVRYSGGLPFRDMRKGDVLRLTSGDDSASFSWEALRPNRAETAENRSRPSDA